jgi:anti-sigma regulatory factor (Ser/Thr protein kinase)
VLADGPESVRSILQTTGTTRFVALRDSVEAAFAAAAESPPRAREVLLGSADLVAAHRARAFAAEVCRRWGLESLADTTALVVSELVTNIVRHVGGDFELRLERRGGLLRIAVRDWGPGLRRWPDPPSQPLVESGAGLMIVSAMSQFHGTAVHPGGGNVVWAALRAEPEETEPEPAERVTAERVLDESPSGAWRVMLTVQWLPSRPQVIELRVAGEPAHPALPSGEWLIRRDALARGLQIPTQTSGVWLVPDSEAGLVTLRLPLDQPVAVPISWFRRLLEQTGS